MQIKKHDESYIVIIIIVGREVIRTKGSMRGAVPGFAEGVVAISMS